SGAARARRLTMNSAMQIVGWTLIHFLWQGTAIALVIAAALRVTEPRSPNVRYLIACAGLAAMLAAPAATARLLWTQPQIANDAVAGAIGPSNARPFDSPLILSVSKDERLAQNRLQPSGTALNAFQLNQLDRIVRGVTLVWLAGVVLLLARMAGGWWHVRRLHHHALATSASRWQ